eukprot:TRINITY_DN2183_c0_g1_i23.p1 TRINITY_DN2183_c0_g1~~TRINITY_DN2183_c0_g1_i23.p1  ORF type:complete len:252 (-),score=78.25 TRINITY_DN2183_c0_g1_i23:213-968(-)
MYDDEDDKPRRRKIQSREARRIRVKEREQDKHETMKELHEEEIKRKEQEKRQQELEQQKLLTLQREREREEWKKREQETKVEEERKIQDRLVTTGGSGMSGVVVGGGTTGTIVTTTPNTTPKRKIQEPSGIKVESVGTVSPQSIAASGFSVSLKAVPKMVKAPVVAPGFNAEPVEEEFVPNKKRKLVTLDNKPLHATYVKEENPSTPEDSEKKLDPSALMASIPSDKVTLFSYTIDWDVIDKWLVWIIHLY